MKEFCYFRPVDEPIHPSSPFPQTQWSLIKDAAGQSELDRAVALEELCRIYWPPVFAFIRSRGNSLTEAEDLTQGFFAEFLLRDDFAKADENRGKLRTYLLTAVTNYMSKDHRDRSRMKRGGGIPVISLDLEGEDGANLLEPTDEINPEKLFDQQWLVTTFQQVMDELEKQYGSKGKLRLFHALKFVISSDFEEEPYAVIAKREGMTESAVRVAAHRLRDRYRELFREAIAETIEEGADVEAEIQDLMSAFS